MSTNGRNRSTWTPKTLAYLQRVQGVLEELEDYWPLTLRQVYYRLVAAGDIENNRSEYQKLSRILTTARLDGKVPWDALEDRARATLHASGWADSQAFVEDETERFLEGYRRDLLQSQSVALEVWVEKDALSRVCHKVAFGYCVPVIVARGFSSVSYLNECRERVRANHSEGKEGTRILYFGDLDPSGWEMLPSMMMTLQEEMGLAGIVDEVRCALTPEQVEAYNLPRNPDALKPTDSRARKFVERFGDLAVELDALPPATLAAVVRDSIEQNLDLSQFQEELKLQVTERERLKSLRETVRQFLGAVD
jgi:hypothetical protein